VLVSQGLEIRVIVSVLVLALLGCGVRGALTTPPPDE
jgi:predicted small lipoprotein YifL